VRFRPPVLLAARLLEVERVVERAHDELLLAVAQDVRDVDAERDPAALVHGEPLAVHPDRRLVVDGPEAQPQAAAVRDRRRAERPPVPAGPEHAGVADAAGRGLRGERHPDLTVERDAAGHARPCVGVERELPAAVEARPVAAQQGAGMVVGHGGGLSD